MLPKSWATFNFLEFAHQSSNIRILIRLFMAFNQIMEQNYCRIVNLFELVGHRMFLILLAVAQTLKLEHVAVLVVLHRTNLLVVLHQTNLLVMLKLKAIVNQIMMLSAMLTAILVVVNQTYLIKVIEPK